MEREKERVRDLERKSERFATDAPTRREIPSTRP